MGASLTRRSSSATGAAESTTCPVGITEPSDIALRIRNSTGSRPSRRAHSSIWDS